MINIKQILADNGLAGEDPCNIINAVAEMLYAAANDLKKTEPYAVTSISNLEVAAGQVCDLTFYIT